MTNARYTVPNTEALRIGEVARIFGVTVDTIREWEKLGKIESFRTLGNQRRFSPAAIEPLIAARNTAA